MSEYCANDKFPYIKRSKRTGPEYGQPSGKHPFVRCPTCNRRLQLQAAYCIGGEFVNWRLPEHKVRETRRPGPTRQSKRSGRGK